MPEIILYDIPDFIEQILSILVNAFTLIGLILSALLIAITNIYRLYRLKKFSKTKRPTWLSEHEFYYYTHNFIYTRLITNGHKISFNRFIKDCILKSKKQYHIVLGEAGTGKSTFLVNLYFRYNCKLFKHNYNIKFLPLKSKDIFNQIEQIENKVQTILLLDAFDESDSANVNAKEFFIELEKRTQMFAKIIITSRNNFFDCEEDIPTQVHFSGYLSLDFEKYNRYYLYRFSATDTIWYIIKKYKFHIFRIYKSFKVIRQCKDMVCRPLVISYIDLLIQESSQIKNIADVYERIIYNWIKREAKYILTVEKNQNENEIIQKFYSLVCDIAIMMYNLFPTRGDYYINIEELNQNFVIFLEKKHQKRNRSLFNRVDSRLYFVHKSILEYLLAENFSQLDFRFETNLDRLYNFMRERNENDLNAPFNPLFRIHHTDKISFYVPKENGKILRVYSNDVPFISRSHLETLIKWYENAASLPVFLNQNLYNRNLIKLKISGKYEFLITDEKNNNVIDKVMQIIKNSIANHISINIAITTYLVLKKKFY